MNPTKTTTGSTAALPPTPTLGSAIRSESTKLFASRTTWTLLGVATMLTVGASIVIALFGGSTVTEAQNSDAMPYETIFYGSTMGVWAYCFVAAGFVANEYRSGALSYTLWATPRRRRLLSAKLIIVAALGIAVGLILSIANLLLTQATLLGAGLPPLDMADPGLLRPILLFVGSGMAVQGVLCAALSVLTRNAPAAVFIMIFVNILPVMTAQYLGETFATTVPRLMPGALLESVAGLATPGTGGYTPTLLAALTLVGWLSVLIGTSMRRFRSQDI